MEHYTPDEITTDEMGLVWFHLDYAIDGFDEQYRLVFPVPERVAMGMEKDELWFQIEHRGQEILEPNLMGLGYRLARKGIITDLEALTVLSRKARESQSSTPDIIIP